MDSLYHGKKTTEQIDDDEQGYPHLWKRHDISILCQVVLDTCSFVA